jgi:2-methylcitrate dehydratase PrpD
MTAVGLLHGTLTADHYEDEAARDPRIDSLRRKMTTEEDQRYSKDYLDPAKRSIANAVQIFFKDGTATDKVEIEYPVGHRRRRAEAIPLLEQKFGANVRSRFPVKQGSGIMGILQDQAALEQTPVHRFVDLFII